MPNMQKTLLQFINIDGLHLALLSVQLTIIIRQGCYHSDPVYLVNVASINKLTNWVSLLPITGPQLNSMTKCQSSIINLLFKNFQYFQKGFQIPVDFQKL